jgi:heavy metal sensor kinase
MRFPRSIRWRLQLWYGALLTAVLCGFGFTAFHLESARQFRRMDEGLQVRISALVDALRAAPDRGQERKRVPELRLKPSQAAMFGDEAGHYFVIWMQSEEPILRSANAPADVPKPNGNDAVVRMRGDLRESFLFSAPVDCVLVGRSISGDYTDLRKLAAKLVGIGALVLAAGLVGGWWLATRAIRPIEDISAAAAKIADGDLSQRISTTETDSELGKLAGVLNSTFARLDAAFAQQARFTADAAHELRTPVAVMLTQTQSALARDRPADEYRETLEACQRATQRMRRLIEALLELARLDAGQETMRHADCDLSKIAADCIGLVRPLATGRNVSITAELSVARCPGDPDRLAQVLTNLLTNAIEHSRSQITVHSGCEDGSAVVTVTDDGLGIGASDLPHIFERFYRANRSRSEGAQHNGLGLAISKAIVEAHKGTLEVRSIPGEGATFVMRLAGIGSGE